MRRALITVTLGAALVTVGCSATSEPTPAEAVAFVSAPGHADAAPGPHSDASTSTTTSPAAVGTSAVGAAAVGAAAAPAAADAPAPADEPAWLRIPAIGVDTATVHLDLRATWAEVPRSYEVAGWYRQTAEPGTVGPAVIVGHVGSRTGPGVFARLDELRVGDEIEVVDDVGVTRRFVVDRGAMVDKYDRPPEVFGRGEDRPELRLITCGGEFDPATGHHRSNYVVWAHEEAP